MLNGVTTQYPFAHYEVTGSTVTKYYFAGSQAVALNQGGTLSYLFSDHLGGTAVTATQSGVYDTELRYKAWGETRYTYGTAPTAKHYTGRSEEAAIGLYFYNARWYDPALSRFAQADSIVPEPGSPLGWDRFTYSNNNPVRFNDPSGYCSGSRTDTNNPDIKCWQEYDKLREQYPQISIWFPEDWVLDQLTRLGDVFAKIVANGFGGKKDAFLRAFSGLSITRKQFLLPQNTEGIVYPALMIMVLKDSIFQDEFRLIHEFGHAFDFNKKGVNGYNYYSQEFVDQFNQNKRCTIGILGCLSPNTIYDPRLNLFSNGQNENTWNPSIGYFGNYSKNASIDDYANSFADLIVNQSLNINPARKDIIKNQLGSFSK